MKRLGLAVFAALMSINLWVYAPLCLVLGGSFFLLLLMGDNQNKDIGI